MGNDMSTQALNRKIGDAVRDYVAFKALESKMESHKEFFKDLAEKQKQTDFVNSNGDKVKVSPRRRAPTGFRRRCRFRTRSTGAGRTGRRALRRGGIRRCPR